MKKKKLLLGCGCGCALAPILFIVTFIFSYILDIRLNENIAKSPKKIASEAGFDLPDYLVIHQEECYPGTWVSYDWEVSLKEPLSKQDIEKLNQLVKKNSCWSYDKNRKTYKYEIDKGDDGWSNISINVDEKRVELEYSWDNILD